mmetsp:Transcript_12236/g.38354  ORF Transcript_12236/g.38354 Transcript_12236/m.38354 type:complete len:317 (-) Transcript_12236:80-1030(-)
MQVVIPVLVVDVDEATLALLQALHLVLQGDSHVMAHLQRCLAVHDELNLDQELGAEVVCTDAGQGGLGVVVLCKLLNGSNEFRVCLLANQHVDLLHGREAPGADDVDADDHAAHRVEPPRGAVQTGQGREEQRREVGEDVVEVVQCQRLERDIAGTLVLELGRPPDYNLHHHHHSQHCRGNVRELHLRATGEIAEECGAGVVDHSAGGQDHEHSTHDDAHGLQARDPDRVQVPTRAALGIAVCAQQNALCCKVNGGIHEGGQHRQGAGAQHGEEAKAPPREGDDEGDLNDGGGLVRLRAGFLWVHDAELVWHTHRR